MELAQLSNDGGWIFKLVLKWGTKLELGVQCAKLDLQYGTEKRIIISCVTDPITLLRVRRGRYRIFFFVGHNLA